MKLTTRVFIRGVVACALICVTASFAQAGTIIQAGLHEFFDNLQSKMNTIDECVFRDFFAQRPSLNGRGH